jgi:hypothetical protein
MKTKYLAALCFVLLGTTMAGGAQSKRSSPATIASVSGSRYFQLTLNLKFGSGEDQQPSTQTITTEVAVRGGKPGSCKARMISQVPTGSGSTTKYLELGTKLDCNNVHIEGDGIALEFALETSRVTEMIKTKGGDGVEIDEPLIAQRTVQLMVKLPLDQAKVVFDSSSKPTAPLKSLSENSPSTSARAMPIPPRQDPPMLVEMTASELK